MSKLLRLLLSRFFVVALHADTEDSAASGESTDDTTTEGDDASTDDAADDTTTEGDDASTDDEETLAVAIGAEPDLNAPADDELIDGKPAPAWVKEVRAQNRELVKRNRELEALRETAAPVVPAVPVVGDKPTMEGCDFNAEKYEADLAAWMERKRAADDATTKAQREAQDVQDAWKAKVAAHNEAGAKLKVPDFTEAQTIAAAALTVTQQSIIVSGAAQSALLMYALGKDPEKLKELAAIKDPVKFAFAAAAIEKDIKVATRKKQIPPPEPVVRGGNAGTTRAVDSVRDRLDAEANRTGDRTKVAAYIREKALRSKSK